MKTRAAVAATDGNALEATGVDLDRACDHEALVEVQSTDIHGSDEFTPSGLDLGGPLPQIEPAKIRPDAQVEEGSGIGYRGAGGASPVIRTPKNDTGSRSGILH